VFLRPSSLSKLLSWLSSLQGRHLTLAACLRWRRRKSSSSSTWARLTLLAPQMASSHPSLSQDDSLCCPPEATI
jgi:hypothetical protein